MSRKNTAHAHDLGSAHVHGDHDSDLDLTEHEHGDITFQSSTVPTALIEDGKTANLTDTNANGQNHSSGNDVRHPEVFDDVNTKDYEAVDWHVQGQGRRVGYENLSAIDWIFEYTKERQRKRRLQATSTGILGTVRQILDASNVWFVLIATGLMVGVLAAFISIASDWLGDIKTGFCSDTTNEGQFYLSKQFCCWGHDDLASCQDWTPWRKALRVGNLGGAYVVEYIFFVLFATFFAACSAILVKGYSQYAKQSGIPEIKTMLGGYVIKEFLGGWTLLTKSIGICLSVASGLWLGKEGPLVHLACCCANIAMRPFPNLTENEARKREVVSAAAASGISVAFGAPVGGVLFSLEQLSYYFPDKIMWQSFVCAMIAAVTLQALNPFHTGKIALYQVTYSTGWHNFELVPFVMLGIVSGLFGAMFIRLNMLIARIRKSSRYPLHDRPILEVSIMACIAALINFPNLFMRAQLSELVYFLFAECAVIGSNDIFGLCKVTIGGALSMATLLLTAAGLGTLLASISFALPIPAGIILPSLAIGALYGRALGVLVELLHRYHSNNFIFASCAPDVQCVTPGTYAIVGAASALAGTTRMTVSIVVIMFELTGALNHVLPIMIAVLLAKWVADVFGQDGIYDAWIRVNQYPYIHNRDDTVVPQTSASTVMTRMEELICIDASRSYSVEDLRHLIRTTAFRGFPVISPGGNVSNTNSSKSDYDQSSQSRGLLLGYVSRRELSYALNQTLAAGSDSPAIQPALQLCSFAPSDRGQHSSAIDLRAWVDQTPITIHVSSSLQLAVSMFQKLGLRYLLLVEKGNLKGIITKKDIWHVLNMKNAFSTIARDGRTDAADNATPADQLDEDDEEAEGLLQ